MYRFLQYEADHIISICGELDPWASTQIQLIGRTDAVKIVVSGGHHGVGISDFTPGQRESCYASLERRLNLKLTPSVRDR